MNNPSKIFFYSALYLCLVIFFVPSNAHGEILSSGPFSGADLSIISDAEARIIREANEDFVLVQNGYTPKNAQFDEKAALPLDGGTTYYKGRGYYLTVVKSLSSFGGLEGYIYGPDIKFDNIFAPGNSQEIKSLRFYSTKALDKHLKKE